MALALMVRILFTVLKAVLILFLAIILFILLVLGIALLSPAKYEIRAEKYDVIKAEGKVSWLFGIIRVFILYNDDKYNYNIKIFGIDYNKFSHNKKEKKQSIDNVLGGEKHEEETIKKNTGKKTFEKKEDKTTCKKDKESKTIRQNSKDHKQNSGKRHSKKTGSSGKIHEKTAEKKEKTDSKRQKISKIKEFIFAENTKCIAGTIKNSLLHLLLKIKPRKIKSDILFGTGDACQTGQVLGVMAIYMAMTNTAFNITPDFENKVLRGKLEILGHIQAISFLFAVLKVILNRQWRSFYKDFKKFKEDL